MLNTIAFIPARGGSKGLPRKALRLLGDKPLIAYTIQDALAIKGITKVFVSTDDPEIQAVSIEYGAEVPFLRPPELAQDKSDLHDALMYSYAWYEEHEGFIRDIEIVMSPTYPFRRPSLINSVLDQAWANPEIFNIGSIAPADVSFDNYWTVRSGEVEPFQIMEKGRKILTKPYQSAFSFNIVFVCRPNLYNQRVPVVLNEIESIDIDEPQDLELARSVIAEGWYPFNE